MEFYLIIATLHLPWQSWCCSYVAAPVILSDLTSRLDQTDKNNSRIENTVREEVKTNRQELTGTLTAFQTSFLEALNVISKTQLDQLKAITDSNREELTRTLKEFQAAFDRNVESFNNIQKEKFGQLEVKQHELIQSTEKKLEQMRETVDEKLQKTLNERLGQSFELVSRSWKACKRDWVKCRISHRMSGDLKKSSAM
jgi:DNA recombination protein RmuC